MGGQGLAFIRRQHLRLTSGQGVSLAIADHDTDEALGLVTLACRPQPGNAASQRVLESNGSEREESSAASSCSARGVQTCSSTRG